MDEREASTDLFINIIQNNRIVYDTKSKDFKNVNKKDDVWVKIAKECRMTVDAAKKRYHSLRQKHAREKKKQLLCILRKETFRPSVFFERLQFLDGFIKPRRTFSNDTEGMEIEIVNYDQENVEDNHESPLENDTFEYTEELIADDPDLPENPTFSEEEAYLAPMVRTNNQYDSVDSVEVEVEVVSTEKPTTAADSLHLQSTVEQNEIDIYENLTRSINSLKEMYEASCRSPPNMLPSTRPPDEGPNEIPHGSASILRNDIRHRPSFDIHQNHPSNVDSNEVVATEKTTTAADSMHLQSTVEQNEMDIYKHLTHSINRLKEMYQVSCPPNPPNMLPSTRPPTSFLRNDIHQNHPSGIRAVSLNSTSSTNIDSRLTTVTQSSSQSAYRCMIPTESELGDIFDSEDAYLAAVARKNRSGLNSTNNTIITPVSHSEYRRMVVEESGLPNLADNEEVYIAAVARKSQPSNRTGLASTRGRSNVRMASSTLTKNSPLVQATVSARKHEKATTQSHPTVVTGISMDAIKEKNGILSDGM